MTYDDLKAMLPSNWERADGHAEGRLEKAGQSHISKISSHMKIRDEDDLTDGGES